MKLVTILMLCLVLSSCSKDWLEVKTNRSDVILSTVADYQALLDNDDLYMNSSYPLSGQLGSDDYYVTPTAWAAASVSNRNGYVWAPDIFAGGVSNDWNYPYVMIEYANICLEGLQKLERSSARDNIEGSAHYFRAQALYNLVQIFSAPYDASTAATDLGVPIRLSSNVNLVSVRASVADTYKQILDDLARAAVLLPASPAMATRPSVSAAHGLLARVYLSMRDYAGAFLYADKVLQRNSYLLDFNTLNPAASFPLPTYQGNNKEIIIFATVNLGALHILNGLIDTTLYRSYAANDLRRTIFFKTVTGGVGFKGQYTGANTPFGGIANNELFLIRAEAGARLNNTSAAMADLNTLLVKRWKAGTFTTLTAVNAADALGKILVERRKELLFYGNARWDDLRRLNRDPVFAKILIRNLNGTIYTLPPNDPKYVYPIPDNEIRASGIQQNPR